MENHSTDTGNKPPFTAFLATTVLIFFLSLSAADSIGFVPSYIDGSKASELSKAEATNVELALKDLPELGEETPVVATTLPTRIAIAEIGLDLPVQNPSTRDIATLDALLPKGPARYVDSAKLGEKGNVIIFAHSSHLPVVRNQMYKAFNKIPELKGGEIITVTGANGIQYLYVVISVRTALVDEATIDLSPKIGTKLTLVTCDTLTSKASRFILDADFIGTN